MKTIVAEVDGKPALLQFSRQARTHKEKKMWEEVKKQTGEYPQFVNFDKSIEEPRGTSVFVKWYKTCIVFAGYYIGYSIKSHKDATSSSLTRCIAMGRLLKGHEAYCNSDVQTDDDGGVRIITQENAHISTAVVDAGIFMIYGPEFAQYKSGEGISEELATIRKMVDKEITRYIKKR